MFLTTFDVAAAVIGFHDESIRQCVEHFGRECIGRCDQRYQMLVADFPGNIFPHQKLVGQVDIARIRMKIALQDLLIERHRTNQVRIAANAFVM
ncbi:hypothetical protein OKW38_006952 [Paraburkholderia sp. MM5496-R1]